MKVYEIIGKRKGGKTVALIKSAAKEGACIVCASAGESDRIEKVAKSMRLKILKPVTYDEFIQGRYRGGISYHIDNVEDFLNCFSGPVTAFTFTSQDTGENMQLK